jgi:hypothetical protein
VSVSIYYTACRSRPLTCGEQAAISEPISRYPLSDLLAEHGFAEAARDGEGFGLYPADNPTEPDVVFGGSTKLTLCDEEAFWMSIKYWCRVLSEIRRILPDADWRFHLDDADIVWCEVTQAFDPSVGPSG